jgi:aspartyl-tRNA(Asn)/glutamyl-tRNA(Gln) amidotransferase subunit A
MPDRQLHFLTIAEASDRIRDRELSPVELTKACLKQIKRLDGKLNAFILLQEKEALASAKKAEAEIAAGKWKGPLHGIPIGLKDIYNTKDVATTGHSALYKDHVPTEDATTVKKLRAAGAVIMGKLSTWEFAIGGTSFDLPWPPARNPWNLDHDPSGSSSGSGAGVASGMFPGAMGTDTGGSIRGPAAWCGIAGLKPTYGLVSRRGILPLSFSLDHAGPMCWTAEDCALMMQVLAGHDPDDPASAEVKVPDFVSGIGTGIVGVRVGVLRHFYERDMPAEPEVVAAMDASLKTLTQLGAELRDVSLSPFQVYSGVGGLISRSEAFALHQDTLVKTPELYGELARRRIMVGGFVQASDYVNALRHRTRLIAELAEVMKTVDVIVFPTAKHAAARIEQDSMLNGGAFYNRAFNLTGSPALSVCNGFTRTGLPLALQIVGRPFEDPLVLKVGDAVEKAMGTRMIRPEFATEAVPA